MLVLLLTAVLGAAKEDEVAALMLEASLERARGHFREAVDLLTHVISLEPTDARAHLMRGQCLSDLGEPRLAIRDLDRCTELDPKWALGYRILGNFLLSEGQLGRASAILRHAVRLDDEDADAWDSLGLVWLSLAQELEPKSPPIDRLRRRYLSRAEACLTEAITISPEYFALWFHRAVIRAIAGASGDARADLDEVIERRGEKGKWLFQLAGTMRNLGEPRDSLPFFEEALTCVEDEAISRTIERVLGEVYLRHGRFIDSLNVLEKLVEETPDDAQLRLWLGDANAAVGRIVDAADEYRIVLDGGDDVSRERALVALARLLALDGYTESALNIAQAGLEAGFRSPRLLEVVGTLAEREGQFTVAQDAFDLLYALGEDDRTYYDDPVYLRALATRTAESSMDGVSDLPLACELIGALLHLARSDASAHESVARARDCTGHDLECQKLLAPLLEDFRETLSGVAIEPY